jgi:hypothetical protein
MCIDKRKEQLSMVFNQNAVSGPERYQDPHLEVDFTSASAWLDSHPIYPDPQGLCATVTLAFITRLMRETLQYRKFNTLVSKGAGDLFIDFLYALETFAIAGKIPI